MMTCNSRNTKSASSQNPKESEMSKSSSKESK